MHPKLFFRSAQYPDVYIQYPVRTTLIIPSTPRFQPQETIPNVITVFSAPNYIDRAGNMAAVAVLTNQGGNLDKQHLGRQR